MHQAQKKPAHAKEPAHKAPVPSAKHAPHLAVSPHAAPSHHAAGPHAAHAKPAHAKPGQAAAHKAEPHAAKPHAAGHPAAHAHVPAMLSQGSHGAEVRMLQLLLVKHGVQTGPIDGIFGPLTQHAVIQFQEKHGIKVDGIVGPGTWGELRDHSSAHHAEKQAGQPHMPKHVKDHHEKAGGDKHAAPKGHAKKVGKEHAKTKTPGNEHAHGHGNKKTGGAHEGGGGQHASVQKHGGKGKTKDKAALGKDAKLRKEVLKIAESQVGTKENGSNGGGARKYQKYFGRGAEPWCADFVSWVFSKAGKKTNSPYCPTFIQQLKKQGRWKGHHNPKPGDIVFFDWGHDGKADHVGIVKHVNHDGSVETIEGNTGKPGGGQEGVWEKKRYAMQIVGYGDVA
jgi:hypothetical protein